MLKSYMAVAFRHLSRQKLYASINIAGLAVGLATYLLISLYVARELSFDAQFAQADRIYRVSRDYFATGGARARVPASTNAPVATALLQDFPEIEQAARVFGGGRGLLARGDIASYEQRFRWADNALFDIFDFGWIAGDAETALVGPQSIVLTERLATKYFGSQDPLGQTLLLDNRTLLTVTGVIRDLPDDTHLSLDALASLSTLPAIFGAAIFEQWESMTDFHTYIRVREGADIEAIERRIPEFLNRHVAADASASSGLTIMKLRDIHLRSTRNEEWKPPGSVATVYGFTAVALLILAIACINFMNLATARSATRAKEVGLRKTLVRRGPS
jgi:putative ABC transport system permease protein